MTTGDEFLFVCGTLRSGSGTEWSRRLQNMASLVGAGRTRGVLYQLDGYPGMLGSPAESSFVVGEVYRLNEPAAAWPMLDEYEGCGPANPPPHEFQRQMATVEMDDGATLQAWAYFYRGDITGRKRIVSGDYLRPR